MRLTPGLVRATPRGPRVQMRAGRAAVILAVCAGCLPAALPMPPMPPMQSAAQGACFRQCLVIYNQCKGGIWWAGRGFGALSAHASAINAGNACVQQLDGCYQTCPP
jgi:hypothetical protein